MRCALVLFSNAALEGFSGLQVSRAPGSTVVSSHSSPADLAESHPLRSSRWSVDVEIANAIPTSPYDFSPGKEDGVCIWKSDVQVLTIPAVNRSVPWRLSKCSPIKIRLL